MKPSFKLLASLALVGLLAACGGGGSNSADTPPVASTPPPPPSPPPVAVLAAPTGLAMSYTIKTFNLSWSASEKATGYQVFEDPNGTSGFTQVGATTTGTTAAISVSGLLHTRLNAKYAVRACNASGCSANSVAITPDLTQAIGYFKASNAERDDEFGSSVALSADGNTLAVGAVRETSISSGVGGDQADNSVRDAGAVYIYVRSGGVWTQQAYVKASNTGQDNFFGISVALSGDGNTLAVGAYGENSRAKGIDGDQIDGGAPYAGAVYVFARSGIVWKQQAYVKASNTLDTSYFGASVAFSADGNTLAVGSPGETTNASDISRNGVFAIEGIGAVYIFSRNGNGTGWSQQAFLKASNLTIGRLNFWSGNDSRSFGASVALSDNGNTLAVGVPGEDSNATGINGDQYNTSAIDEGAAYVFTRTASVWAQQAYIKASNTVSFRAAVVNVWSPDVGAKFGGSVALSGDGNTLAVGAKGELSNATGINGNQADNSAARSGAVYVFTRADSVWSQQAYVKASNTGANDGFGIRVAL